MIALLGVADGATKGGGMGRGSGSEGGGWKGYGTEKEKLVEREGQLDPDEAERCGRRSGRKRRGAGAGLVCEKGAERGIKGERREDIGRLGEATLQVSPQSQLNRVWSG